MDAKLEAGVDPRLAVIPDSHGHAKGEHKPYAEERPIPYTARMLFLWFFHACRRGAPRFMMVADHMNYLTFEDPAAVNLVRRALKLAQAGDLYGAAETAGVEVGHAQVVSEGLRRGMRYSIGAEVDNDPRCRPDAQNIVDAMKPDGMVRSVHFLPITHPTHGENWMWAFDNPEFKDLYEVIGTETVWEIYMATLLDAIDKLPGNIVGHFYVPAVFGHWPAEDVLEGYEDKLVDACAERGMAIELNSRYLYKHYLGDDEQIEKFKAVHIRLMRKAAAKGVGISVGSDAHSPKDQSRSFEAVLAMLDEAEINEISFPIGGRLARVALRATEEIMKQFAPPEPEPAPTPPPAPEPVAAAKVAAPEAKAKKPRPSRAKAAIAAKSAETAEAESKPAPETKPKRKSSTIVEAVVEAASAVVASIADVFKHEPAPEPEPTPAPAPKAAPKAAAKPASKPAAKPIAKKPAPVAKKAAPKKPVPAAKKSAAPAKKSAAKPVAKKSAPKAKPAAKKAVVKAKPAAKKPVAKKPVAKKPAPKKAPAKKTPAKKAAPAKKSAAKKAPAKSAKRPVAKRPAAKKAAAKKPVRKARR